MEALTIGISIVLLMVLFAVLGLAYLVFWIFMTVDCVNRPFEKKLKWLMIINLVPFGSVFYYFIIKRNDIADKKMSQKEIETLSLVSFILGAVAFKMFFYLGFILGPLAIVF